MRSRDNGSVDSVSSVNGASEPQNESTRTCYTAELGDVKEWFEENFNAMFVEMIQESLRCWVVLRSLEDFRSNDGL